VFPSRLGKIENDLGLAKRTNPTIPCNASCITVPGRLIIASCHFEYRIERKTTNQVRISTAEAIASVVKGRLFAWCMLGKYNNSLIFALSGESFICHLNKLDRSQHG